MKILKRFESFEHTSSKEAYLLLSEVLTSNLLDDWGIRSRTDEEIGIGQTTSDDPINKFWTFCEYGNDLKISSNVDDLNKIDSLVVYNLGELEIDKFLEEVKNLEISEIVKDLTGYELSVINEDTYNDEYGCYFNDVIFKLYKNTKLKNFNESKSMLDSNNLNDILIDLSDIGYEYYIQTIYWSNRNGNRINITFYGPESNKSNMLYYDDLGEYIERINNYLNGEGYEPWPETIDNIEKFKIRGKTEHNISFEWKQD